MSVVGSSETGEEIWYCMVVQDQSPLKLGEELKAFPKSVWCNKVEDEDVPKR